MKFNQAGADLVKRFEGLRLTAYYCPAGVLTIGYGHTSMAGAPTVTRGMKINKKQASDMLLSDMRKFSDAIRKDIKVELNNNQFSALSSFAYNVGIGGFRKSSVLKRVNAGKFDQVPSRLNMWVKAGGRTMRGLVRRRAAEGALFMLPVASVPEPEMHKSTKISPTQGKSDLKSTTNWAAVTTGATGVSVVAVQVKETMSVVVAAKDDLLGLGLDLKTLLLIGAGFVIVGCVAWIIKERRYKTQHEGV